ncbi:SDR family oxidoreductase [Persicimonas caeni]|nr:NAD(P)H-binding protein [Persicimonas caeni]
MDRFKVCVLGGSGFIGAEICRLAVAMGHRVVSVSRGGRPPIDEPWVEGVDWVSADVGDVESWSAHLAGCEALVHSVGIAAEDPANEQTYRRLHRHSVQQAARAAEQAGVPKFVMLSAGKVPPAMPHGFLQSKLDGEASLQGLDMAVAILRPVLVHDEDGRAAGMLGTAAGELPPVRVWAEETTGLRREKVAMAALRAALQPETTGVLEVDDIAYLGDAMFIQ